MNTQTTKKTAPRLIAQNKKARHDYHLEERFEAGLVLEGWEVKSIRAGRVQLKDSYVLLKQGEAWLIGVHISPLKSASTHVHPAPDRTRKLLLNERELNKLIKATTQAGFTVVPVDLHWSHQLVKADIAIAKGKKEYDKRETLKRRDWEREKQRSFKQR